MREYEQVNGLWLPKYVQRNGVWVKREQAQDMMLNSAFDALRVIKVEQSGPTYWFYGPTISGYLPYQETAEEAAVSEAEAILRGDS